MKKTINVAFVGNPNCGKTTLFNARITGLPNSSSCIVRKRFRSMAEASTILTITSISSSMMHFLVTFSSIEYEVRL